MEGFVPTYKQLIFQEEALARFLLYLYKDGCIVLDKYIIKIICTYILFGKNPLIDKDLTLIIGQLINNIENSAYAEYKDYYDGLRCNDTPSEEKFSDYVMISGEEDIQSEINSYELFKLNPVSPIVEFRMNSLLSYLTLLFNKICIKLLLNGKEVIKQVQAASASASTDEQQNIEAPIILKFKYILNNSAPIVSQPGNSNIYNYYLEHKAILFLTTSEYEQQYFSSLIEEYFHSDYNCTAKLFISYKNNYEFAINQKLELEELQKKLEAEAEKKRTKRQSLTTTAVNPEIGSESAIELNPQILAQIEELNPHAKMSSEYNEALNESLNGKMSEVAASYVATQKKDNRSVFERAGHRLSKRINATANALANFGKVLFTLDERAENLLEIAKADRAKADKLAAIAEEANKAYNAAPNTKKGEQLKIANKAAAAAANAKAEADKADKAARAAKAEADKAASARSKKVVSGGNYKFKNNKHTRKLIKNIKLNYVK